MRLTTICLGELAPASLVKEIDISQFFVCSDTFIHYTLVAKFIETLSFKQPDLSILACGELCGFLSIPVLAELHSGASKFSCFSNFEYTDFDFDLTDLVRAKCPTWGDSISRKELDIEADLANQEVELESYDVVIAFHTLGPSKSLRNILENSHKLLRSGGKLLLIRLPTRSLVASTMFGFLPSLVGKQSASSRDETAIFEHDWASVLSETGYSHDTTISNSADKTKEAAVILTALPAKVAIPKFPAALIVGDGSDLNISARHLQERLSTLAIHVEITSFENARPNNDQICIFLSEPKMQILTDTSEIQWDALKRIFLRSGGVLWVTRGASVSSFDPESNLISGIMRTVRSENGEIPLLSLDLDFERHLDEIGSADSIISLFERYFQVGADSRELEYEYAERNGVLMIPRLLKDKELTDFIPISADDPKPEIQPFRQPGRPLRMHVGTPGLLDSMYFIDDDRLNEELPPDWLQIEIKATGINFKDVMMALGQITVKDLGIEASGIVTALGKDITQFQLGDRVLSYGTGLFSTDYRGPARIFHKIPNHLSFETAASIPIAYATAYYSCHYIARLQKGETVLVHAASGGLGQAIIELCQLAGAEVYATVGTAEKKEFLIQHFNIPEDHIFFSRNGSFAKGVKRMTRGKGVDVIMNSLAGENLRLTWDCIAPWGRFVELGQRDIMINTRLEMQPFKRNATFSAFLLDDLVEQKPDVASKVFDDVIKLFSVEAIRGPAQIHTYPITEVEMALRTMQTGGHMGKLVAVNNPADMVKVIPQDNSKNILRSDVSYMLVGGLGGIGRATALWMTDHGARNLILINRSGPNTQDARDTVEALKIKGASVVVYSCDITNAARVEETVAQAGKEMPPIKGVIQGAMILRVSVFALLVSLSLTEPTRTPCLRKWY
jgi:NADPH:quinone reductase-like Zn-dependent oxidoreductase